MFPLLTKLEPEFSHRLALRFLRVMGQLPGGQTVLNTFAGSAVSDPRLQVNFLGQAFPNPIGVAAGMDKDASAVAALFALGFGAVEIGTVTPLPQSGNDAPRLWRVPEHDALINALGFPSKGVGVVRDRLAGKSFPGVLGINLGKNRETTLDDAAADYANVLSVLWDASNYAVINVSSPNTPGLRDLQRPEALTRILRQVCDVNRQAARIHDKAEVPLLVKISPDLTKDELHEVIDTAFSEGAAGLIVANTTTSRDGLSNIRPEWRGGLSGQPVRQRAISLVSEARQIVGPSPAIIGAGGVSSAQDVIKFMRAGANTVQLCTGFVYGGPGLPRRISRDLISFVEREGLHRISDIIGADIVNPAATARETFDVSDIAMSEPDFALTSS